MNFKQFLYQLLDAEVVCKADMHYEIEFPDSIKEDAEMCKDLLEEFEKEVKAIAWKMGLKLTEK